MTDHHILIVEDEVTIREMLRFTLERNDFSVGEAANVQAARVAIANRRPDLLLLDWMLPGVSGVEFARELKKADDSRDLPIIMVTARIEEEDKVRGLNLGCDDYVTKPFSASELVARIRAVLRRTQPGGEEQRIEMDGLVVDGASHRVTVHGQTVQLGPTEYRLLHFFVSNPERVYSREQVLDRVWGHGIYVEERTVDVHIRRLRKALSAHGLDHYIQTVRGTGYRFSTRA